MVIVYNGICTTYNAILKVHNGRVTNYNCIVIDYNGYSTGSNTIEMILKNRLR